ncbi:efflux RND transporter periplasmic adaptor subunit [Ramlibacter sp. USB13]|uniref:Efflux RND transporter periplasmic adaptor subunit n=1 Tax=Ramlibacter cellulosilyticus TaxID=2764187 RepID=A0A923SAI3_9BURK|nr:efflux RND transporter periplasmic adaptor subunit [Ramlibacter cellulosilyticus]MBC5782816.1 efflux RND transporter periplasmic adaptor subunit [Ramlibacter cellulosilyticus]
MHRANPLAAAALALAVLAGCGDKAEDAKKAQPKPALTVTTVTPQQVMLPVVLAANGNLAAWQEASVGAEASGLRISDVLVNVGDRVRRGQVLARFAADTVRAEAAQAQAAVAEAEAAAAEAANNAARARTLQQTGAMSASQINQYLTAEKTAQARVEAARAQLQQQQVRLNQTQVLAPDDGVISARTATVGAVVNNGTELFRLIRKGRLEWRAEVTSSEIARLTPGTRALVTATSNARLEGRVRTIGPTVDPQSRIAIVYVDVNPLPGPAAGSARAGMFARGEFDLGAQPALTVPQQSLVVREGFNYLMRVLPDNRVNQVKVQIGRIAGDRVEVLSGVDSSTRIVASGGGFLNEGDLVRVTNGPAPTAAAGAASAPNPTAPAAAAVASAAAKVASAAALTASAAASVASQGNKP